MHRFYVPSQNIIEDKVVISDASQIHHIKDVLRLKIKDEIIDKLSQLGVDRIIPLKTRRAIVDLDNKKNLTS